MSDSLAVVPYTGEALALREMPLERLAVLLDDVRMFELERLRAFKRDVQDEILRRLDERAEWTWHGEGFKLSGDSPNRSEWDVTALRKALWDIVEEGLLPSETVAKAIKAEVTYKPVVAGINSLLKLGGEVAERIEACRLPASKPRAVRVSRA